MKSLNRNQKIAAVVGILVVGFFFIFGQTVLSVLKTGSINQSTAAVFNNTSQVSIQDITIGNGGEALPGTTITVNYVGKFTNGQVFDSSISRGTPFTFTLGAGQVIVGWDKGVVGMKVGGKRILVVPPELGYGPNDYGPIPANSTLIFEVDLLGVSTSTQPQ